MFCRLKIQILHSFYSVVVTQILIPYQIKNSVKKQKVLIHRSFTYFSIGTLMTITQKKHIPKCLLIVSYEKVFLKNKKYSIPTLPVLKKKKQSITVTSTKTTSSMNQLKTKWNKLNRRLRQQRQVISDLPRNHQYKTILMQTNSQMSLRSKKNLMLLKIKL